MIENRHVARDRGTVNKPARLSVQGVRNLQIEPDGALASMISFSSLPILPAERAFMEIVGLDGEIWLTHGLQHHKGFLIFARES